MKRKRSCAAVLAALLTVCALLCPAPALAALVDTTPCAAVEIRIAGALTALPADALREGFTPEDFGALPVESVIPVRETCGCREAYNEEPGTDAAARWILVPASPTQESAEALAAALAGKTVAETLGAEHPLAAALLEAHVVPYRGREIYSYETLLVKVWAPARTCAALQKAETLAPAFFRATEILRRGELTLFVLWPNEAGDFEAACAGLEALWNAGLIYDGVVAPTFEVSPLLDVTFLGTPRPYAGDPDGDGIVTAADAREALRAAADLPVASPDPLVYDTDGDKTVTAADARLLLRMAVELEPAGMHVTVPSMTSGRAVIGPVEEHTDGGKQLTAVSSAPDALQAELIAVDLRLPNEAHAPRCYLIVLTSRTPGAYRVTVTETRPGETETLSERVLTVIVR